MPAAKKTRRKAPTARAKRVPRRIITPPDAPQPADATTDAGSPGDAGESPPVETSERKPWRETRWAGHPHLICSSCNYQTGSKAAMIEHVAIKHAKEET